MLIKQLRRRGKREIPKRKELKHKIIKKGEMIYAAGRHQRSFMSRTGGNDKKCLR